MRLTAPDLMSGFNPMRERQAFCRKIQDGMRFFLRGTRQIKMSEARSVKVFLPRVKPSGKNLVFFKMLLISAADRILDPGHRKNSAEGRMMNKFSRIVEKKYPRLNEETELLIVK